MEIWEAIKKEKEPLCSTILKRYQLKYQRDNITIFDHPQKNRRFRKLKWRHHNKCLNFDYLPQRGGKSGKLKEGNGSKVQEQVLLKGGWREGGWNFSCLIFYKVYHFYIFTLPFAKLSYAFEEKHFFSVTIILWKKSF